jgi:hypothetical protein
MGVIATDDPFEAEDVPVAFWFGKPLGIVPEARGHAWEYNCNLDTTSIDECLIEADRLPVQLRNHDGLRGAPAFVAVGTEEDEDAFLALPHHIPMKTHARSLVPIYFGKAVFPEDMSRWRQNKTIAELEDQQSRINDRAHSADLSDSIRLVWRYRRDGAEKEEGFLVGMRVGFGLMNVGILLSSDLSCNAVIQIPEASWAMPVTELSGDALIDEYLRTTEPAIWCGVSRSLRRVKSISKEGDIVRLELDASDIKRRHSL